MSHKEDFLSAGTDKRQYPHLGRDEPSPLDEIAGDIGSSEDEILCGLAKDGSIIFSNDMFMNLFHISPGPPGEISFYSLVDPSDIARVTAFLAEAREKDYDGMLTCRMVAPGEGSRAMSWRIITQDMIVLNRHVKFIVTGSGMVEGSGGASTPDYEDLFDIIAARNARVKEIWLKISQEIIKRKLVEKKLDQLIYDVENEVIKLKEIVQNTPELLFVFDAGGCLQYTNDRGSQRLGVPAHLLIGKHMDELELDPRIHRIVADKLEPAALQQGPEYGSLTEIEGEPRCDYSLIPLQGISGDTESLLIIVHITDEHGSTSPRLPLRYPSDSFLHSFNNLFTALIGNLSLARESGDIGLETSRYLFKIESDMMRVRGLIEELSESGQDTRSALASLLREVAAEVAMASGNAPELAIDENLQQPGVPQAEIRSIIDHLLLIHPHLATPRLISAKTQISDSDPLERVLITFVYPGAGISLPTGEPESSLSLRRVLPESGALCRRVESLHGGLEISVQPGDAIKVFLYFPTAGEVSSGGPPEGSKTPAGKGYVLFMDDDEGVLETTTKLLEKMGFSPLTAKKGEEIIRIFSRLHEGQNPVSAVILDLDIPRGMGALRTLPVLKHIDPGLKVILTSGHTSHPVVRKYHRFGFAGVLIKPYDQKKLTEILQEVLFNSVEQDYP